MPIEFLCTPDYNEDMLRRPQILSVLLFSSLYISGRFILAGRMVAGSVTSQAILSETLLVIVILSLSASFSRKNRFLGALFLITMSTLHIINIEMISSLQTVFHWQDIVYSVDAAFLKGSLLHTSFLIYALFLTAAALFHSHTWARAPRLRRRVLLLSALSSLVLLTATSSVFPKNHSGER